MRGSSLLFPVTALVLWAACIAWPTIALIISSTQAAEGSGVVVKPVYSLLLTSMGWSAAVAMGAIVLGLMPGRALGGALGRRGFVPLASMMLVPICMPSYIIYYAWWQSWPADSELYRWIVKNGSVHWARQATLYAGLVCWSWPLVSWAVAWAGASRAAHRDELLQLDHASPWVRWIDRLRTDAPGIAIGALFVFLATLANTTSFDLAEVFTFSNELRAIEALQATPRQMLSAAWPQIALCAVGAATVWRLTTGQRNETAVRPGGVSGYAVMFTIAVWLATVILPIALFARHVLQADDALQLVRDFFGSYHRAIQSTIQSAAISGVCGAILGVGLFLAWLDDRTIVRGVASGISITFLFAAIVPASVVGVAMQSAYHNVVFGDWVFATPLILTIGHMACFGFVAALLARWCARRQPRTLNELRMLDGVRGLPGVVQALLPQIAFVGVGTFAIILVFSFGEIPVTAVVAPPARVGSGPLSLTLLNDMHYQRPQTVMMAAFGMAIAATIVAFLVALAWRILRSISGMGPDA